MRINVTPGKIHRVIESIGRITISGMIRQGELSEEETGAVLDIFARWSPGEKAKAREIRRFGDSLYECLQGHLTQADWSPDVAVSLWVKRSAPGVIPEWKQPTGAQDAYSMDKMVTHVGRTWISLLDGNVWEPGTDYALWAEVQ